MGIWVSHTPGLSTRWILVFTTSLLTTKDHSLVLRTLTALKKCGDLKRICWKKIKCATPSGTLRILTTIFTTKMTSPVTKMEELYASTTTTELEMLIFCGQNFNLFK